MPARKLRERRPLLAVGMDVLPLVLADRTIPPAAGEPNFGNCVPQVMQTKASTTGYEKCSTLRMPSWASISSKPRFTSAERHAVRDERVDVDLAGEPALDQRGHAVAALDPAERRAGRSRRPVIRKRGTMSSVSPLPATPATVAEAPAHPGRLDRLATGRRRCPSPRTCSRRRAGPSSRGSPQPCWGSSTSDLRRRPGRGRAAQLLREKVHEDDPALRPEGGSRRLPRAAPTPPSSTTRSSPRATAAVPHRGAEAGREPAGEQAGPPRTAPPDRSSRSAIADIKLPSASRTSRRP